MFDIVEDYIEWCTSASFDNKYDLWYVDGIINPALAILGFVFGIGSMILAAACIVLLAVGVVSAVGPGSGRSMKQHPSKRRAQARAEWRAQADRDKAARRERR